MTTVIFACVHNAGRSQMAAAWFNRLASPSKARAVSAGTAPGERVHPEVLTAMREVGLDLTAARPQLLDAAMLAQASHLVTMGCGEACPVAPPGVLRADWPFEDPRAKPLDRVREIRDEIRVRVERFVREAGWDRMSDDHEPDSGAASAESGIRRAEPADLATVLDLARGGGLLETGIGASIRGFLLALDGDRVMGACGLEEYENDGLLRTLVVHPEYRNRGVGQRLVVSVLAHARQRELGNVYLLTTTAREFFVRLGFRELGRAAAPAGIREAWEFKTGCPATAVFMGREP